MLLLSHTWLIRNSAWWWRKEVPQFSIPSSCIWYFKTVQCVSIFPLENHKFPALSEGFGPMIPISVVGMLVGALQSPELLAVTGVWAGGAELPLLLLSRIRGAAATGLVPELALLAVRLRFLQYICNYHTLLYILLW